MLKLNQKKNQFHLILDVQIMIINNLLWTHQPAQEKVTIARTQDSDKHEQGEEHLELNHS